MTIAPERLGAAPSPVRRAVNRMAHSWDKTPGKLRVTRLIIVLVCLTAGGVSMYGAQERVDVARQIARHTEPLSADAVEVYRSLADADAAVAEEFLRSSDAEKARAAAEEARAQYDAAIKRAATSLAHAGTQASDEGLSTDRIARIAAALPVYTGLVERARAHNDVEKLREASARMQSTILRQTEALQRDEAGRLNEQYRQAGSLPVPALALGGLCLGALVGAQALLFRRTKRVVNVGLLVATAAVVGAAVWWSLAMSVSHPHLRSSQRHSQSVTAALGQAQIAARQARTTELLSLRAPDPSSDDENFMTKMQLLARQDGEILGGALGAASAFASDDAGRARVAAAVVNTNAWLDAHKQIKSDPYATTNAFNALDDTLRKAVEAEDEAFATDIHQAQDALARPVPVTGVAALLGAAAAAWGLGRRLEEYR